MIVEYIAVGTEILLGNILNTNSRFIAEQMAVFGNDCFFQNVVGDNKAHIKLCLKTASERSDCVLLTGGLGMTGDDVTKEAVAEFCGRKLSNENGTMLIEGAKVLDNDNGAAPGYLIEENNKVYILLPGHPEDMKPLFKKHIIPYFATKTGAVIVSKMVKLCGISEAEVHKQISDIETTTGNPTVAPYVRTGEIHIRVTAKAKDEKAADKLINPVVKKLKTIFGMYVYSTEEDVTLEESVVDLLLANNLTVSTVESCTGGLVAGRLINVPGVSDVFKVGHITYSNHAKRHFVGVPKSSLDKHTAVSREVAEEMAKGGLATTKADVVVSVTGLAGPDGGTEDKPVGLVYIGCNVKGKIKVKECYFKGDRMRVRESAVTEALNFMRLCVLEYYSEVTFGK